MMADIDRYLNTWVSCTQTAGFSTVGQIDRGFLHIVGSELTRDSTYVINNTCKIRRIIMTDTNTLRVGDEVWTVDGEWISNFADGYYDIKIPAHVSQQTVTDVGIYGSKDLVKLTNGALYNIRYGGDIYLTKDEAVKALREERKQFLINYPNDWQKIIEELQQLLKEQSDD